MHFLTKLTTLLVFSATLASCSGHKYNAQMFDDIEQSINIDFIENNKINTSSIKDRSKQVIQPVYSDEQFEIVFKSDYKIDLDYNKQFLIVFSFTSIYKNGHYLKEISLNNGELVITCDFKEGAFNTGYACEPYQRWCSIKMDLVDYNEITFKGE